MQKWKFAAIGAATALSVVLATPTVSAATTKAHADPAVIADWNAIAARTISGATPALPVQVTSLYFGFVSIAVYDAVVAIEGGYEPYNKLPRPHRNASAEAAAATAAHRTLAHYFPAAKPQLDADYTASLAKVPDGTSEQAGVSVGEAAAQAIIDDRANDGRDNPGITPDMPVAPGVWRPTPPALAPMSSPWLGFVKPLTLKSAKQVWLPGPDSLRSKAYARDVAEVQATGAKEGSTRTPRMTETALFWSVSPILQYQAAVRGHVTRHAFDIARSARTFAAMSTATADALISCWRAKYDDPIWRPITAIQQADTDGNKRTEPDPTWAPLIATPPYPEYTSGHACVSGSTTEVLGRLFGKRSLDLEISSTGPSPSAPITRHYDSARALDKETMNARIWLGIHFRRAMTDGNHLGHRVADWTMSRYFRPTCK